MKKPKTEGLEWLGWSLIAFNGSGYADMADPEAFLQSYIAYKKWRKRYAAVKLAEIYYEGALEIVRGLLETTYGASRSPGQIAKFEAFKEQDNAKQERLI